MSALLRLGIDPSCVRNSDFSSAQSQTRDAFAFKWARRETYDSPAVTANLRRWLFERYCGGDPGRLSGWLAGERKIILDAGCGSGFSGLLFFGEHLKHHDYLGVDISSAVDVARSRFAESGCPGDFLQMDLLNLPIPENSLDMVFSEGVLHHTDSTELAIKSLARKLKSKGRFLFYVYIRKADIREFTDDFVREKLRSMTDEQAWAALKPLTKLGIELGRLNVELNVPEDIPYLGIKAGSVSLQRFFYWNICKAFYREDFNLDEMNHINFDWFRPMNCHRQTVEEVRKWCAEASLYVEHLDASESGITVVGIKQ